MPSASVSELAAPDPPTTKRLISGLSMPVIQFLLSSSRRAVRTPGLPSNAVLCRKRISPVPLRIKGLSLETAGMTFQLSLLLSRYCHAPSVVVALFATIATAAKLKPSSPWPSLFSSKNLRWKRFVIFVPTGLGLPFNLFAWFSLGIKTSELSVISGAILVALRTPSVKLFSSPFSSRSSTRNVKVIVSCPSMVLPAFRKISLDPLGTKK